MCKKLICFVFVMGLLLTNPAGAELIGWWKLNDGSGTVAVDSSGYDNDGTFEGNPQWVEGKIGGALDFDGTNDYVDCGNDPLFGIDTNQMTVAAWVTVRSNANAWQVIAAKGEYAWRLSNVNLDPRFHFGITWWNQPNTYSVDGSTAVGFNEWHHVAGSFDGTNINVYLDGVLDGSATTPEPIGTNDENVLIGNSPYDLVRFWDGLIDDVRIYNVALTPEELADVMIGESLRSSHPSPEDGATFVTRGVVLSWDPGSMARTHDVYFGTDIDDVNEASTDDQRSVLLSTNKSDVVFDPPGDLDYGQKYYWRVDEVNEANMDSPWKGQVWSFTAEPFAYTIENIKATASSYDRGKGPENTVNGSGLQDDLHSIVTEAMWLSTASEPGEAWIEFEFDRIYKLYEMWVWNYNAESILALYGLKEVKVEYSIDDSNWTELENVPEFEIAPGENGYAHNTTVAFNNIAAKYVKITAISNHGGGGSFFKQYGLSEVRFLYIPVYAVEPIPDTESADVPIDVTLQWKSGREASEHVVYLSDNIFAIDDGTAPSVTLSDAGYGPLSLDLGNDYYWRVDEVNDTEVWASDIWNFRTQEFIVVDDFESYGDFPPDEVWSTWIDGYNNSANGSTAGYPDPDFTFGEHFVETDIVHSGSQSMPLLFDNTVAGYSEVTANTVNLMNGSDWSRGSAGKLVLWFYGDPGNPVTEQLYVKINNDKILYDDDAGNIAARRWNLWIVDLLSPGINLSNITTLSLGFERTGVTGGTGIVLIDDIRLYKTPPPKIEPIDPGANGLVAHYAFENNVFDSSGNRLHGTVVGNPTYVDGAVGTAMDFDGNGDYVDCGNDSKFNFTNAMTVATWVNIRTLPQAWTAIITKGDSAWRLSNNNTSTGIHFGFTDGSRNNQAANSATELNPGEWYHVCGVYDINVGAKIYINGVEDGGNPDTGGITQNNYGVFIAENSQNLNRFWDGLLDEVMIYDRALSDAEVLYLASQ